MTVNIPPDYHYVITLSWQKPAVGGSIRASGTIYGVRPVLTGQTRHEVYQLILKQAMKTMGIAITPGQGVSTVFFSLEPNRLAE